MAQGTSSIFVMYTLFTLFSSVAVSISALMQPIFTLVLAYAMLGERLVPSEFYFLIAALVGSIAIVSANPSSSQPVTLPISTLITGLMLLVASPMLLAGGTVSMR